MTILAERDVKSIESILQVLTKNVIQIVVNVLSGDLRHVVRTLQACSLTPGFIDVYSDDKATVGQHGTRILNVSRSNSDPSHPRNVEKW